MPKSSFRTIVALLLAAAVPATLFAVGFGLLYYLFSDSSDTSSFSSIPITQILGDSLALLYFTYPVALIHLAALGIPAFLYGFKIRRITWQSTFIISFLIGAIPWGLLFALTNSSASNSAWQTIRVASTAGATMGILGASGGMTFWLLWHFWVTPLIPNMSTPPLENDLS